MSLGVEGFEEKPGGVNIGGNVGEYVGRDKTTNRYGDMVRNINSMLQRDESVKLLRRYGDRLTISDLELKDDLNTIQDRGGDYWTQQWIDRCLEDRSIK
ncbi:hypothetical protein [Skermanella stibiiresistens]|uniref:hypothetical protein n=1 Tax=Skermanella stibiiresistens TaxID=913326 RepID=UPI0012FC5E94|nr:hypothetical protein [Skermanella stibiiresistens]